MTISVSKKGNGYSVEVSDRHDNIVTELCLKAFFENLDHIPLTEIEALTAKYQPK